MKDVLRTDKSAMWIVCLLGLLVFGAAEAGESILRLVDERTFLVRDEVTVRKTADAAFVYLPYPDNGPAQTIKPVGHGPGGEIVDVPGWPGERLLRIPVPGAPGTEATVYNEYRATLWAYRVDIAGIDAVGPRSTGSPQYDLYTRRESPAVNPDDGTVRAAAAALAADAGDDLDFARKAYEYVTARFKKTFVPSDPEQAVGKTIAAKTGTTAQLENVLLSLLRAHGIPARKVYGEPLKITDFRA